MSDQQFQITPLRTGQMGVVRDPGASTIAMKAIIEEARAWGILGFDLEWVTTEDGFRHITWCGVGHAGRAVSFWWPTLPEEARAIVKAAIADPTLPKMAHNIQADIRTWTENFGEDAVGGLWEDTMLIHHAAYPGIAHDLQQVTSQHLVVPPWKTWHREDDKRAEEAAKAAAAQAKAQAKEEVKAAREQARDAGKIAKEREKVAKKHAWFREHYPEGSQAVEDAFAAVQAADMESIVRARDHFMNVVIPAETDRIKAERKAAKAAAHEARNAQAKAEKAERKQQRQENHEAQNEQAKREADARRQTLDLFKPPRVATQNPLPLGAKRP